ncbi:NADP-dependent isocitrate dehydrogenase [Stomatohabitans albus]|uniref:NADP-dependent isocitrate dehydrogenase n=1 Tax=Stomatohabitans albus TaxID=3110766 RepID=UPI00300D7796
MMGPTLTWTVTDESPRLAGAIFIPILTAFLKRIGVQVATADISLAARILAAQQKGPDMLVHLGELVASGQANIVKTPNISASAGQIVACINELNAQGENLPQYPDKTNNSQESAISARYEPVKGSAVNPVLRQGNSDRRAPESVKAQAKANPHWMGAWAPTSQTEVMTMADGDFRHTEQSVTLDHASLATIVLVDTQGNETILHDQLAVEAGDVLDGACLRADALQAFLEDAYEKAAQSDDVVLSAHLKATMMKVSDPVIFGRVVATWMAPFLRSHMSPIEQSGWTPDQGLGSLAALLGDDGPGLIKDALAAGPVIAMADSPTGLSTLHAPNTTIIDASMPAMIRAGGKMADPDGTMRDTIAVIPDSSYADLYQAIIDDCKAHGAYDPATMGTVPNVGLMANKAEEYGSHDKTFIIDQTGTVQVRTPDGTVLIEHAVRSGDIWRACLTKNAAIRDWVRLAIRRALATGWPAVFWLDQTRAHDRELMAIVSDELDQNDTDTAQIYVMDIAKATAFTVARLRRGENTLSVSGNVLRDYLTDMFPIIELGTSSRMLSIVPLMAGGGLYETGAGGTAPLLVQQVLNENHFQWDSLGEYMALVPALEQLADDYQQPAARILARTLDDAISGYLDGGHTPGPAVGDADTRTAGYWIARYWAQALAEQTDDPDLATGFASLAHDLKADEALILDELTANEGKPVDLGGYYRPDPVVLDSVMRPSRRFNALIDTLE